MILESLNPHRTDVYYRPDEEKYYLVGIKYSDLKYQDGHYQIDEGAYAEILRREKMIADTQSRADLESLGYEYRFSLYRNDIIEYEKDGERYVERFLSRTMPKVRNYVETKPIDAPKYPKQKLVGLGKTKLIQKICTDILGNRYYCDREKFKLYVDRL